MSSFLDDICPGPSDASEYDSSQHTKDGPRPARAKYMDYIKRYGILNPFKRNQACISLSYLDIGIVMNMLSTPVTYYMIDRLQVSSRSFSAFMTFKKLPWSFKFLMGLLSDRVPIMGYRRKSWLLISWLVIVITGFTIGMQQNPSFRSVAFAIFIISTAYIMAYVCCDTLVVERAKLEHECIRGTLQTSTTTMMTFGMMIGSVIGALLFNRNVWGWGMSIPNMFLLCAMVPITSNLPLWWSLEELTYNKSVKTLAEALWSVWGTLQLKAVWWPMTFIYIYQVMQIPNGAWTNFLVLGLGFDDYSLGIMSIMSAVLYWLGMVIFKKYLFHTSWRKIYIYTTLASAVFAMLQIMLICRINVKIGIPDLTFALGDSALTSLMYAIQTMPASIMFVALVPEGQEGLTFAILGSIANLAWTVANDIGSGLTTIFSVSNEHLINKDYSGLLLLEIITSVTQIAPLALVWMLPDSKKDQTQLRDCGVKSFYGGLWILFLIIFSFLLTTIYNFYLIWREE